MKLKQWILGLLILGLTPPVWADDTLMGREGESFGVKSPGFTFTWFGGNYFHGLEQQKLDCSLGSNTLIDCNNGFADTWNMGMRMGIVILPTVELEASFGYTPSKNSVGPVNVYTYSLNGLYNFLLSDTLVPYGTFGIGGIYFSPDIGTNNTDFAINYGAGLKWFFLKDLALRPDARGLTSFGPTHTALMLSLNLTYYFGLGQKAPAAVPPKPPEPVVIPPPPVVVETPTPSPTEVPSPTPTSSPTPTPAQKELKKFTGVIKGIQFKFNKATIEPTSYPTLDSAAVFFVAHPKLNVQIEGHSDSTGPAQANQRLSRERAESVYKYLVKKGVSTKQMEPIGYGPSQPLASNATKEGRKKNRRIEFKVLNPSDL